MGDKVRLLFVIDNVCYGGGEKVFSMLIRNLPPEKFELFCAARRGGRFFEETSQYCEFVDLDLSNRFDLFNLFRLKRIMLQNGIHLIHSQGARADFFSSFAAAMSGVKAVSTVAMPVEGFDVGFFRKRVYVFFNAMAEKFFSGFITVSGVLKERLAAQHGIPPSKIKFIPNPVDIAEFSPSRYDAAQAKKRFGVAGKIALGALGRLEWQKGFEHLLRAVDILIRSESRFKERLVCLIAGGGSLEAKLKKLASGLGLGANVVFCGQVAEAGTFLAALDIFVMPSLLEGQPLALLEAMAMRRPIVASDIPGISGTAARGKEALLVKPGDAGELARGILKLIDDETFSGQLAAAAAKKAEQFGLRAFIEKHEAVYNTCVGAVSGTVSIKRPMRR